METQAMKEAKGLLRMNIQRLARLRTEKRMVPMREVWPERQLLFSLVHGLVCAASGYSPMGDLQLQWADWFLDVCEDPALEKRRPFLHEEAALMLILEWAIPACARDRACGE